MRKTIVAGNWKMNASKESVKKLMAGILSGMDGVKSEVLVCAPFPYLSQVESLIADSEIMLGAQNLNINASGAFTGEVSASMIKEFGAKHVIVGHSERREYFGESDAFLAEKTDAVLAAGSTPIFCCGEPLDIREAGTQNSFVETQLKNSLFHLSAEEITKVVIAYEPIWAIGTGKTASSEQAQEIHAYIRSVFAVQYGQAIADQISILYGGSVKASNAKEIFSQPDVDGGLVGGASLIATEFVAIINALK